MWIIQQMMPVQVLHTTYCFLSYLMTSVMHFEWTWKPVFWVSIQVTTQELPNSRRRQGGWVVSVLAGSFHGSSELKLSATLVNGLPVNVLPLWSQFFFSMSAVHHSRIIIWNTSLISPTYSSETLNSGGGGAGVLCNFLYGGVSHRDPTLNPFIYHFGGTRYTFRIRQTSIEKCCLFHMLTVSKSSRHFMWHLKN